MSNKSVLKGVFLVGIGATSYGMLATFVHMAYDQGYKTSEVTISQFVIGIIGMLILHFLKNGKTQQNIQASNKQKWQLMLAGTSTGLTSVFYYLSVKYIPVSIAIVLLMQTVWIGVLVEYVMTKHRPSLQKIISVLIVLFGTFLATNVMEAEVVLDWRGLVLGLLAACSFTTTMFTANHIATALPTTLRSLFMLLGGAVVVFTFAAITHEGAFQFDIFYKWGIVLSLFGTIIPPLLLNAGFPLTGIGLGSIVSAMELPTSVLMAYFLLGESVNGLQWTGIVLILLAIVIMNISFNGKPVSGGVGH